jgi:hypothetical protein
MSSYDFKDQIKECNLVIKQLDETEHLLTCTILEFLDKIVIHLAMDGETDISYDIQIPELDDLKKPVRYYDYNETLYTDEDTTEGHDNDHNNSILNSSIVPTVLIGAGNNMKTQVLASQIGHVMCQQSTKNIILNISGRIFGGPSTANEYHQNDSLLLQQAVYLVKQTYES